MQDDNSDIPDMQAAVEYKRLTWNTLFNVDSARVNGSLMLAKECWVARRVLQWLNDHPEHYQYRDLIKEIAYRQYTPLEATSTLHFNLWIATNASVWISPRDASASHDLLWQFALMRLSAYLHTGSFTPASQALNQH